MNSAVQDSSSEIFISMDGSSSSIQEGGGDLAIPKIEQDIHLSVSKDEPLHSPLVEVNSLEPLASAVNGEAYDDATITDSGDTTASQDGSKDMTEELDVKQEMDMTCHQPELPCNSSQSQSSQLLFSCKYCGHEMKKLQSLQRHEEAHRKGTIYKCRFCNYHSVSRAFMEGHESIHTGVKPYKCDYCDHRTRYEFDMKKHQRVHFSARKYKCPLCPFQSKWKSGVNKHLQTHSDVRQFSCHLCSARFKRKSGLKTHLTLHSSYKPFKCDECDYTCRIRSMLLMHARSHSNVRNFFCTYPGCAQSCKTKSDLTKHSRVHIETCDFVCKHCGKAFKTAHSLSCHIQRHEEKSIDFTCSICQKKLSTRFGLRKHLSQHVTEKRHACPICGHKFHSLSNMRKHTEVHAADRNFECPICKFSGKEVSVLLAHIGAMHGREYTYFCELCRKPFSTVQRIKQHVQRCHGGSKLDGQCEFVYDPNCCAGGDASCLGQSSSSTESSQDMSKQAHISENSPTRGVNTEKAGDCSLSETMSSKSHETGTDKMKEELADKIINNADFPQTFQMEKDASEASIDDAQDVSNQTGQRGGRGRARGTAGKGMDASDGAAACLRSVVIKLEKLPDGEVDVQSLLVKESQHPWVENASKIIKIGSMAGVGVCLAGRDSGFQFNLEKRGKKIDKWYMNEEYMSNKDAGKMRKYWDRKLSSYCRKQRHQITRKGKKGTCKKKNNLTVQKPKKRKEKLLVNISTPVAESSLPRKRKSGKVKTTTVCNAQPDKSRKKFDPPPVNFDVFVKCERLDLDDLNNVTSTQSLVSNLKSSHRVSGNVATKNFLPGVNTDALMKCERLSRNEIHGATVKNKRAVKGSKRRKSDNLRIVFERLELDSQSDYANPYPDPVQNTSNSGQMISTGSKSINYENPGNSRSKKALSASAKSPKRKPGTGIKKKSKSMTETIGTVERGDETGEAFVEEPLYVEDIMDSPFKVTWKTRSHVLEDSPSNRRRRRSYSAKIVTKVNDNDTNMDVNKTVVNVLDVKPRWLTTDIPLSENAIASLSAYANDRNSCSVEVEDIGHVIKESAANVKGNDTIPLAKQQKLSSGTPKTIHTISLDEFEKEYGQKKKLVAKVDVVKSQPKKSLPNGRANYKQRQVIPMTTGDNSKSVEVNSANSPLQKDADIPPVCKKPKRCKIDVDPAKTALTSSANPKRRRLSVKMSKVPVSNSPTATPVCLWKNRGGTSQQKTKEQRRVGKKGKLSIASLFGNTLNKPQEKANKPQKKATKNKSAKKSMKELPGRSSSKNNDEIVNIWKMAFECLMDGMTVNLCDCKSELHLHREESYYYSPGVTYPPSSEQSRVETVSLAKEFENNHALSLTKAISPETNFNSEQNAIEWLKEQPLICSEGNSHIANDSNGIFDISNSDTLPSIHKERQQMQEVAPNHPESQNQQQTVSSRHPESQQQQQEVPPCPPDNQNQQQQVSPNHPDSQRQQQDVSSSHPENQNQQQEVSPNHPDSQRQQQDVSPSHPEGERRQQHDSQQHQEIPNRSASLCHKPESSHHFMPVSKGKFSRGMSSVRGHSEMIQHSGESRICSLFSVNENSSCVKKSLSEFLQGHLKVLHELFPSGQTELTYQSLVSHFDKWKSLPLPKDFTLDKNGAVGRKPVIDFSNIDHLGSNSNCSEKENPKVKFTEVLSEISTGQKELVCSADSQIKTKGRKRRNVPSKDKERKKIERKSKKAKHLADLSKEPLALHDGGNHFAVVVDVHEQPRDFFGNGSGSGIDNSGGSGSGIDNSGGSGPGIDIDNSVCIDEAYSDVDEKKPFASNPMLCPETVQPDQCQSSDTTLCLSLSDDDLMDGLGAGIFPEISQADSTQSFSSDIDSCQPQTVVAAAHLHCNGQSLGVEGSDSGNDIKTESTHIMLESEVLPPSDDIYPLPDNFFSDLEPKVDIDL